MHREQEGSKSPSPADAQFRTTHWGMVLAVGDPTSPQAAEALEKLCSAYGYPLYAYVQHRGYSTHHANDLTQEFFTRSLAKGFLAAAHPKERRVPKPNNDLLELNAVRRSPPQR